MDLLSRYLPLPHVILVEARSLGLSRRPSREFDACSALEVGPQLALDPSKTALEGNASTLKHATLPPLT